MVITKLEELKKYEKDYLVVPVAKEILSDTVTPIEVMRRLKNVSERVFILESVVNQTYTGRYTFLGYAPKLSLTVRNNEVNINYLREDEADKENVTLDKAGPMESINELMQQYTSPKLPNLPGFTGGLVGYFAFDFIKYQEPVLKLIPGDEKDTADAELMLFDKCIAFDNIKQKLILITNISTQNMLNSIIESKHFSIVHDFCSISKIWIYLCEHKWSLYLSKSRFYSAKFKYYICNILISL